MKYMFHSFSAGVCLSLSLLLSLSPSVPNAATDFFLQLSQPLFFWGEGGGGDYRAIAMGPHKKKNGTHKKWFISVAKK